MENIVKNIKTIKSRLPHGAQAEISRMSGKTVYTVNRVFSGKSKNLDVMKAIHLYIKEMNNMSNDLESFIK